MHQLFRYPSYAPRFLRLSLCTLTVILGTIDIEKCYSPLVGSAYKRPYRDQSLQAASFRIRRYLWLSPPLWVLSCPLPFASPWCDASSTNPSLFFTVLKDMTTFCWTSAARCLESIRSLCILFVKSALKPFRLFGSGCLSLEFLAHCFWENGGFGETVT